MGPDRRVPETASVWGALERLLLPAACLVCRRPIPEHEADEPVCSGCRFRMRPVAPPWCERCGQPRPLFGACRICADWPDAFRRCRSAVWLEQGARDAVHALKYEGVRRVAGGLARRMAELLPLPGRAAVLIPVPLAKHREQARGYNQSQVLATALGTLWNVRVETEVLTRSRETATQTALTPEARRANVAGAFRVRSGEHPALVIVDDVFTTGATLAECARALAASGARDVTAVTFGRASLPDFT
jgi:ComF family protein